MLIVRAEVNGRVGVDVRIHGETVVAVGSSLAAEPGERVVDARGGMLLPGLHDHHLHLLALAAAADSVACGPPAVRDRDELTAALRAAASKVRRTAPGGWVRGVGYHDTVAGALDRAGLDSIVPDVPVRVQHRSGALWTLNSAALAAVGLADGAGDPSDTAGGRLFRMDAWLRDRLPPRAPPDLAEVGARLAAFGVTGVTDMTATTRPPQARLLVEAATTGRLPQRLVLTGGADLTLDPLEGPAGGLAPDPGVPERPRVRLGPVKIVLDDDVGVDLDELVATVGQARARGRRVAVHCVTRSQLVLALAMFDAAGGASVGDRLEHAAVVPPDLLEPLVSAGLTVVTQPHFLAERGDEYRVEVDPDDVGWLYRCDGLRRAGIPVAAGTDAPFGGADPWASMRAAVTRRTRSGHVLGADETCSPGRALGLYLGPPARPGGPGRRITVGAPADLCLLSVDGRTALAELDAESVRLTVVAGTVVYEKD